jgi:type IV fimbrial biogenesis protein FimT
MLKRYKGFTLIELMITVAIAAIVLAYAIPSFTTQMANNRSAALGEDFATAVNYVRSEAVKRRTRVSLCASSNGTSCTGAWTDGFIAFVDTALTDTAPAPVVVAANVLRVWKKADDGAVITATSGGAVTFLRYTGLGVLARNVAAPIVINAQLAHCKGDAARTITVGLSGLVSVARAACPTT